MAPRKGFTNLNISEEFRIKTERVLRSFIDNSSEECLQFPHTLSNNERAWIHKHCRTIGLISKSVGKETKRFITVSKKNLTNINNYKIPLTMTKDSLNQIQDFIMNHPPAKDKVELNKSKQKNIYVDNNMGQLTYGSMQVPISSFNNELIDFRVGLPIWPQREYLMEMIVSHQVIIVSGETGSGKTTQLPQFILDYSSSCNEKSRIICTQPRRIAAVSVAERVALERNERVGQSVGFHIRLESSVGPKTALIYCTNGILLRTLMNGDACLKTFTHIIVDEIHERDRYSDFLLICLRECLINHPHLRLVLMSATIETNIFKKYFNNAPCVFIGGRLFDVKSYYLDDILQMINYESPAMITKKKTLDKNKISPIQTNVPITIESQVINSSGNSDLDIEMNDCIEECFETGADESFGQLLQLILSEHVPVNYQNPENGYSGLMAASFHGNYEIVQQLLLYGASPNLISKESLSAVDYAYSQNYSDVVQMLQSCQSCDVSQNIDSASDLAKQQLTNLYTSTVSDDLPIDFDLLHELLYCVHTQYNDFGSILVFLAGYDDIIICRDKIFADSRFLSKSYQIYTLHGSMSMSDQHKVFSTLKNKRKIILSTNIAETSITIDDVVYVVDCGKVKEMTYDAISKVSALQSSWISQACAKQRAGRAGRTREGCCFHLYSKLRQMKLNDFTTPEILRMPLHELCLHTKMLAPKDMPIADFLARAIEPPAAIAVESAICHLQEIEALDLNEKLTSLGNHLVDLPVEPRLAKMLIYAVILKCLDPLLTIVSTLAYRDPFLLPKYSTQKIEAEQLRKSFSSNTFSDHMILLRAFQLWQEARHSKSERAFCNKHYISSATMEMIVDIRSQLLAQLRATGFVKTRPPNDIRELNMNSHNWALIKAVLAIGFYPNIAYVDRTAARIRTKNEQKIILHHASSLRFSNNKDQSQSIKKIPSDWLIFEELSRTGPNYNIKSVTNVSTATIVLFIDTNNFNCTLSPNKHDPRSKAELTLNNWIEFESNSQDIKALIDLRDKFNILVTKKIICPQKNLGADDEYLVNFIASILTREDNSVGLIQPPGIGQRPRTFLINNYPMVNDILKEANKKSKPKQINRTIPEILKFKPISSSTYNQYLPHFVNTKLDSEQSATSEFSTNITHPICTNVMYNMSPQPYFSSMNNVHTDVTYLSQNMLMMNLYNPSKPETFANYSPCQVTVHANQSNQQEVNDFESNGVDVNDEDCEGACALSNGQIAHQCLTNWFYNCDPSQTSYFIIKAGGLKSIDISISKKTWIFSPQTERKLLRLLQNGKTVILVFTVQGTATFQGIARLLGRPLTTIADNTSQSSLACPIEWLSRADIPFYELRHLFNPSCVDGLELDPNIGAHLCMMFMNCQPKTPVQNEPFEAPVGRAILGVRQYY